MSERIGNFITKNPPIPDGYTAPGIWTLDQAMQYKKQNLWPGHDANFAKNVLLIHADGDNAAQNNTFLDSSSNNFSITRNGNATQGSFSPFSKEEGKWGCYFDGSGDYISLSSNAAFGFGTGDATIEMWAYVNSAASGSIQTLVDTRASNGATPFTLEISSTGYLMSYNGTSHTSGTITPSGAWFHVALVRYGSGTNNCQIYLNGTSVVAWTDTSDWGSSRPIIIGTYVDHTSQWLNGYISNLRIVKGRAVYTSNFTPSTAPLGSTSGGTNPPQGTETSLLCCQSNRFIDNGTANGGVGFTLTPNGNVAVTPFSPFANSASYSASVNGGSGYFDGTGDSVNLTLTGGLGSGDFTVEYWVYHTSFYNYITTFCSTRGSTGFNAGTQAAGQIVWYRGSELVRGATAMAPNTWNHVRFVRSSGTLKGYLNGVQDGTTSADSATYSDTAFYVGSLSGGSEFMTGYVGGVRVIVGTALNTANFTPPTAPPTAITNTQLLLNFTNAAIYDQTGTCDLETVGNAQISTSVKKYGTGSLAFDGAGSYLGLRRDDSQSFGTGAFTIELWMNPTSVDANARNIVCTRIDDGSGTGITLYMASGYLKLWTSSNVLTAVNPITASAWHHIAVVGNGGAAGSRNVKLYINGSLDSTWTSDYNFTVFYLTVGDYYARNGLFDYYGYIDDLRISKFARYAGNFTPPTGPFADR